MTEATEARAPERQKVWVTVYKGEWGDDDWPPENAVEFLTWFQSKMAKIPAGYRGDAVVRIGSRACFDSDVPTLEIYYTRPETDDEIRARIMAERREREQVRQRELAMLRALQAKYGDQPD